MNDRCICLFCRGGGGPCRAKATQEDLLCDLCRKYQILPSVAFTGSARP